MIRYMASVKDEDNRIQIITGEYRTKKEFMEDLRGNGYKVRFISIEDNFDIACENYHWQLEKKKNIQRALRESRRGKKND